MGQRLRPVSGPLDPDGTVVVVGASLAGLRAAEELRHVGHRGPVVMVGAESHPPYDRPPLSKQFLAGAWDVERIRHHAPEDLADLGFSWRIGAAATALDLGARTVGLSTGEELAFDGLVVATGAAAQSLPGIAPRPGVHLLRTLDDCLGVRGDLARAGEGVRLVVVGAGSIGAEVAATCHGLGARVTVVEAAATPLAHVLGEEVGAACGALHRSAGVELKTGVGVAGVAGEHVGSLTVALTDGSQVPADVVVVGVGVIPTTDWLAGSGVPVDDGVTCDERLFATDRVVAAGDVARWPHRSLGRVLRLEHWTNAAESGVAAARNLVAGTAAATPYEPVPFFWSDQYATKIQMVGVPSAGDEVEVVDGSLAGGRFAALYHRAGLLTGALAFSMPRQLMRYRSLVAAGGSLAEAYALSG